MFERYPGFLKRRSQEVTVRGLGGDQEFLIDFADHLGPALGGDRPEPVLDKADGRNRRTRLPQPEIRGHDPILWNWDRVP